MELEKIALQISNITKTLKVFNNWKELVKNSKPGKEVYYIKKEKDFIYIGQYQKCKTGYLDKNTAELKIKTYVKFNNLSLKFYCNKIIINKKAATFKALANMEYKDFFSKFHNLAKKIYNIHPSINLYSRGHRVVLLKEIQNIRIKEYVNKYFPNLDIKNKFKLRKLPVNQIRTISIIQNKCFDKNTVQKLFDGFPIDLSNDKMGNSYYIKNLNITQRNSFNIYHPIDNFILCNPNKHPKIYKLIYNGDVESVKLGRKLFINIYTKEFKDINFEPGKEVNIIYGGGSSVFAI